MPTDKQNVEFLYSIIKQLEVKHINWPTIAESNNIPNGHAARMRFHRLRQAMDGTTPRNRTKEAEDGKDNKTTKRKAKDAASARMKRKLADCEDDTDDDGDGDDDGEPLARRARKRAMIKLEEGDASDGEYVDVSKRVKIEEMNETEVKTESAGGWEDWVKAEPDFENWGGQHQESDTKLEERD